jgi:hypothetical protein
MPISCAGSSTAGPVQQSFSYRTRKGTLSESTTGRKERLFNSALPLTPTHTLTVMTPVHMHISFIHTKEKMQANYFMTFGNNDQIHDESDSFSALMKPGTNGGGTMSQTGVVFHVDGFSSST